MKYNDKVVAQTRTPATDQPLSAAQLDLNSRCTGRCVSEVCYLPDENDCRNFIVCERDARGRYFANLLACAFGTYWAGLQRQRKITCDLPENVICNINYCAGKVVGEKYDHYDGNCKTYWECTPKGPKPFCCRDGFRYDATTKDCVVDVAGTCNHVCPIKIDACMQLGQSSEFLNDGNCRTYWNCEDRRPHPVCCPDGQGYDIQANRCVPNVGCRDQCPREYMPDNCLQQGVEKYNIHDSHCRTYMRCNAQDGDERWCCPSGEYFNTATQICEIMQADSTNVCDDVCPLGYKEFCPLRASTTNSSTYMVMIGGVEVSMPCAPGTLFDFNKCGCAVKVANAPDNSCNMEIDILFDSPQMIRRGSQDNVEIIRNGIVEEGATLNGRSPFRFNGNLRFRTPFGQQQYDHVYASVIFLPETSATSRQVLISNCMNMELGGPTMDLALLNGEVVLTVVTNHLLASNSTGSKVLKLPYDVNIWQVVTFMYDGENLHMAVEGQGPAKYASVPVTGGITVAAEGLDFGGCPPMQTTSNDGFIGQMAKLMFSKCLKKEWVDNFFTIVRVAAVPAGSG
ncbi:uncharacterized protein LOC127861844 [Dreissena polymorpha]|uniref:uncharacterized protein LOC127861844 n=1 Tax=Dreissena polymorpha TaxID=45954 RepID=UPI002263DD37|nr:uncharacterized protein LOC127861844 [Dreissena polymorpha]